MVSRTSPLRRVVRRALPERARAAVRRGLRSWYRSGHRVRVTQQIAGDIAGLRGTVLDIGGGHGAPHDTLWEAGARRIRVDLSPDQDPDVIADAGALPFATGAADAVVMCEVLEHLPFPQQALDEVHRVLRDDGRLCGSVPFVIPVHGVDFFRYTDQGLRVLLRAFADVDVRPHGNHLGGAGRLTVTRLRWLKPINPLVRRLGNRADERCPEGYTFAARAAPAR